MRCELLFAVLSLVYAGCAGAQTTVPPSPVAAGDKPAERSIVHYEGTGVTAPELIPESLTITAPEHCKKMDGTTVLSVAVDSEGRPREFFFLRPLGNELDRIALRVVEADRFKPGAADGAPAAVAVSDEVKLQSCLVEKPDAIGKRSYFLDLRSVPLQTLAIQTTPVEGPMAVSRNDPSPGREGVVPRLYRVGGNVTVPVVLNSVQASYSDEARREKINGICLITLIVDTHGMPQNPAFVRAVGSGLDENALAAVGRYRFRPAMRNGEPVPVRITVEVNFKIY